MWIRRALPAVRSGKLPRAVVQKSQAPRRVLIIEDDPDSRQVMREVVERAGYVVFAAADGVAGIELARTAAPHVAIVDLGLPFMDGCEVGQRLRALCGGRLRMIAVTGNDERARAAEAGFNAHLLKPMSPSALLEAIAAR